jgi:hypothetical protein
MFLSTNLNFCIDCHMTEKLCWDGYSGGSRGGVFLEGSRF